jgi:hypothetical protein
VATETATGGRWSECRARRQSPRPVSPQPPRTTRRPDENIPVSPGRRTRAHSRILYAGDYS